MILNAFSLDCPISGRDPITGQAMTPYDNAYTFLALIIPGATGSMVGEAFDAVDDYGDDLFQVVRRTGAYSDGAIGGGVGLGKLAGREIRVTDKSLSIVTTHLAQSGFHQAPENAAMIQRLQDALLQGNLISGADASFYLYEVSESTMMKRLVQGGLSFDDAYDIAHAAVLNKYEVSPFSVYHPDVIQALGPSHFNSKWWNFWGIKP